MGYSAVAETERFLERHPTFTNDTDNPVELLEDLKRDYDELDANYDQLFQENEELKQDGGPRLAAAKAQIAELVRFIKKLNADRKISDFEMREAVAISKAIPAHLAESADSAGEAE